MKKSCVLFIGLILLIAGGVVFGCASADKRAGISEVPQPQVSPLAMKLPGGDHLTLAQVLSEQTSGLDRETKAMREKFLKRAKEYVAARKRGRKGKIAGRLASCPEESTDPFCPLFAKLGSAQRTKESRKTSSKTASSRNFRQINSWILAGKSEQLVGVPIRDLKRAIANRSSFTKLEKVAQAVLTMDRCAVTDLAALLAGEAEESFPNERYRQMAVELYEKASACAGEADLASSFGATYRLSLLHVWADQCDRALAPLAWLVSTERQHEYGSRALYWQATCLQKEGDLIAAAEAQRGLRDRFPFSLHSILMQDEGVGAVDQLSTPEPAVLFRSVAVPRANGTVIAAESILAAGEPAIAAEVLQGIGLTNGMEHEFRIYLAVLFNRAGQYIEKFKVLTPLFRENPLMASRAALQLYYPQSYGQGRLPKGHVALEMDQLLLLSLIRQESAFNRAARSPAGALGLMQVMPSTARRIERVRKAQLLDPSVNMRIGSKYLAKLARKFDGDVELALAAYNAGPGRVEAWLRRYPVENRVLFIDLIPFKETREYVAAIARNYYWYSRLYPEQDGTQREATSFFRVFDTAGAASSP